MDRIREELETERATARERGLAEGRSWVEDSGDLETILGLVASAFDPGSVDRDYPDLVAEVEDDLKFRVRL